MVWMNKSCSIMVCSEFKRYENQAQKYIAMKKVLSKEHPETNKHSYWRSALGNIDSTIAN